MNRKRTDSLGVAAALLVASVSLVACSRQSSAPKPAAQAGAPARAAAAPPQQPAEGGAVQTVTGTVAETMDASNYTYVRVKTSSGDVWAATGKFKVAVGDRVVVPLEMENRNFHSKTLNRDFPLIYFVSQITREGDPAPPAMALGHTPIGAAPAGDAAAMTEPIAQPAGATPIAGVWADRKALAGKTVTVRGKVVKYNGGILDRNWVHIQDGSGKAADGTNDLTFTTNDATKVGDIVTVTGRVALDKDFSAGYFYKVMLEGATIR